MGALSRIRFPLMAAGVLALVAGAWAGLVRIGWDWQPRSAELLAAHGPLMVVGFLGTVIALERAVALRAGWGYAGPALAALSVGALLLGVAAPGPAALASGASAVLVIMSVVVFRRGSGLDTAMQMVGAAAWLAGNALWLAERPFYRIVPWWGGFLVLTIVGERLDLSRLARVPVFGRRALVVAVAVYLAGVALTGVSGGVGMRLLGAGLLGMALWLARYDIARRTVRGTGLPRFVAVCVLGGAIWLGVSGVIALMSGELRAGLRYDAWLHTLFLGFVFALIFGHAAIILPAVTGLPLTFRPSFYAHLALLHVSLLVRLAGDLTESFNVRRGGGLL
jgi:hypothetical protein